MCPFHCLPMSTIIGSICFLRKQIRFLDLFRQLLYVRSLPNMVDKVPEGPHHASHNSLIINASLWQVEYHLTILLRKLSLDSAILTALTWCLIFLTEKVVTLQLQELFDETYYLDLFQWVKLNLEITFIALMDDPYWERYQESDIPGSLSDLQYLSWDLVGRLTAIIKSGNIYVKSTGKYYSQVWR